MNTKSQRYERQQRFAPIGEAGQAAIAAARVAVLGCGALGSVVAEILARAGVGQLRLIDRDTVEWSNLQRQALYTEADASAGAAKAAAAAERLREINGTIDVQPRVVDVTRRNIAECLSDIDLVVDGSDNFSIRFLLNDYALQHRLPWVHGGCVGATGQVALFDGQGPPCFRCLVPQPPAVDAVETCDTAGVLGSATHAVASWQATLAIRYLVSRQRDVAGSPAAAVWSFDFWEGRTRVISAAPLACPTCRDGLRQFLAADSADDSAVTLCGRNAVQIPAPTSAPGKLDLAHFETAWRSLGKVDRSAFFVRLTLPDPANQTLTLFRDGRAVIGGTEEIAAARSLYARYVGG